MDARALLQTVAETYASLKSLAVECLISSESDDDGTRSESRAKAYFVAPDKLRVEQGGRHGSVTVANGDDLHHYFGHPGRYSKTATSRRDLLPGYFRPDFPVANGHTFLFDRIAEQVVEAEILRDDPFAGESPEPCRVVSVTYEPPPYPGLHMSSSAVVFWVSSRTHLIWRMQGTTTHRLPAHDETHTNNVTLTFTRTLLNEPIPPETFEFTPDGAVDVSDPRAGGHCGVSIQGGGGSAGVDQNGERFESWHSHEWAGRTLIERSKLKLHGLDLAFERRLILSDDRKELRIVERITGPRRQTDREISIPVE